MNLFELIYPYVEEGKIEIRCLPSMTRAWRAPDAVDIEGLDSGENLYFGVCPRKPGAIQGRKEDVANCPCVWVDLDLKDVGGDVDTAKQILWDNAPLGIGNWTAIVASGGGFHAYLRLDEPAGPEDFDRIEAINRGIARKCHGDMVATDIARILRIPGTRNFKYQPPRPVALVYQYDGNEASLDSLSVYEDLGAMVEMPADYRSSLRTEEIERCMDRCVFLQWCAATAKTLPEPAWYAMISNLCGFRGSPGFIHDMSKPYPKYSRSETDRKILQALQNSAPISCEKIKREIYDCGRTCGVKSPAGLAWRSSIKTVNEENPFVERDRKLKELVEASIPPSGWLRSYVDYASSLTDAPKVFHLFSGLSLLGSVVGRRAWVPGFGGSSLYPNLWTVILAPSSAYRKSTAIGIASDLMKEAGIATLPNEFSRESLVRMLASDPHSTFVWSEFGSALGLLEKEYMAGCKDMLADLYDCPSDYRRQLSQEKLEVRNPYLSMLAAGNIDWMLDKKNLAGDLRGGFLARILYVPYTSKDTEMDMPGTVDPFQRARLIGMLRDLQDRSPEEFAIDHLTDMSRELSEQLDAEAGKSEYLIELSAAFARYKVAVLKLALLYSISVGCWGEPVPRECMGWAINAIYLIKEAMSDIVSSVPMNRGDQILVEVMTKMRQLHARGDAWISKSDLCRYTHRKSREITEVVDTLLEMGKIREKDTDGPGRKGKCYQIT